MADSNDNNDDNGNDDLDLPNDPPFPRELLHWPIELDYDDDEFRAGYPFDNISESDSNDLVQSVKKLI